MTAIDQMQAPLRRPRNSLTESVILDAALGIAQSGPSITVRGVASVLGCNPMAIYRYFADKNELLLALLDRVLSGVKLSEEIKNPNERLMALAHDHMKLLQKNSWAIPLLFENPDPGPSARKIGETFLSCLKNVGATNEVAVILFSSILALNYGWAGFTSPNANSTGQNVSLSPAQPNKNHLPETAALWDGFATLGSDRHHIAAVENLIKSLRKNS